jgi:hypothetical protein
MKKIFAFGFGILLLTSPALALADSAIPIGPTPLQLLTRVAALEAEEASIQSGQALACAALFSAPTVEVGQQVILAWGSVGAMAQTKDTENMWPLDGASTLSFADAGARTYPFTFYGAGGTVTCNATITVTQ